MPEALKNSVKSPNVVMSLFNWVLAVFPFFSTRRIYIRKLSREIAKTGLDHRLQTQVAAQADTLVITRCDYDQRLEKNWMSSIQWDLRVFSHRCRFYQMG